MLSPVLFVGCGGSGSKSVRFVRHEVERRLRLHNLEMPSAWQFLGFDTAEVQESPNLVPVMPHQDFVPLTSGFTRYKDVEDNLRSQYQPNSKAYSELIGWRATGDQVKVPLTKGAGQMRGVGRAVGIASVNNQIRSRVARAIDDMASGIPQLRSLSERLGVSADANTTPDPLVVILGSMAGGTGAGIMLDVIDVVRTMSDTGSTDYPFLVAFAADIFADPRANPPMDDRTKASLTANTAAFMSELMSTYYNWDDNFSSEIFGGGFNRKRGPHCVFTIGRTNLRGIDLGSANNVYRAVGDAMSEWVLDPIVQESVLNFTSANLQISDPTGGYDFASSHQPGMVRSFGSAQLAIGRDRFRDYAKKLFVAELVDSLHNGWRGRAEHELTSASRNMPDAVRRQQMLELHLPEFLRAVGLDEKGPLNNQIQDVLISENSKNSEKEKLQASYADALRNSQLSSEKWRSALTGQTELLAPASQARATGEDYRTELEKWLSEVFGSLLKVSSIYSAVYGYGFTADLLRQVQLQLKDVVNELHDEANSASDEGGKFLSAARDALISIGSGNAGFANNLVTAAITNLVRSVFEKSWLYFRKHAVSDAVSLVADQMIEPIAVDLEVAHDRVSTLISAAAPDDDQDLDISSFPRLRDFGAPEAMRPSPMEFFLEDDSTWKSLLEQKTQDAIPEIEEHVPTNFEKFRSDGPRAAILMSAIGGFPRKDRMIDGSEKVPSIISAQSYGGSLIWSPSSRPNLIVDSGLEALQERVVSWLERPDSRMREHLYESFSDYLSPTDANGNAIRDHDSRLRNFREKLQEAVQRSSPLLEINPILYRGLHGGEIDVNPLVPAFPFGAGHPAREVVESIIPNAKWSNSKHSESVTISGFLGKGVSPLCVSSFTTPLQDALDMFARTNNPREAMCGDFWRWRRARVLPEFIPMKEEVREAVVTGFEIARMFGTIFLGKNGSCEISVSVGQDSSETLKFPEYLLTSKVSASPGTTLAALLESFILCFGRYDRDRKTFYPYRELYRLGESTLDRNPQGNLGEFPKDRTPGLDNSGILEFIETGEVPKVNVLDEAVLQRLSAPGLASDEDAREYRKQRILAYLETELQNCLALKDRPFTGSETRDISGFAEPSVVLQVELVDDFIRANQHLLAYVKGL